MTPPVRPASVLERVARQRKGIESLARRPAIVSQSFIGARIENHVNQTIAHNTNTDRVFDTVVFDTDNMVDLVADNRKITIQTKGIYLVTGATNYAPNATGRRICQIFVNGFYAAGTGTLIGNFSLPAVADGSARTVSPAVAIYSFNVGDFISGGTYQFSGGNLDEAGAAALGSSYMACALIGVQL